MKLFLATFLIPIVALAQGRVGITLETVSSLESRRAINGEVVNVLGFSQAGDWGGPKQFRWDATNTLSTNAIRRGTNVVGRWVHEWDGDVRVFGAKGDGVTDDTTSLNAAFAAAGDNSQIIIPDTGASFRFTPSLIFSNQNFTLHIYGKLKAVDAPTGHQIRFGSEPSFDGDGFPLPQYKTISILGHGVGTIDGNALTCPEYFQTSGTPIYGGHGIYVQGYENVTISGVIVSNIPMWAVGVFQCKNAIVDNCVVLTGRGQNSARYNGKNQDGIHVIDSVDVMFSNNRVTSSDDNYAVSSQKGNCKNVIIVGNVGEHVTTGGPSTATASGYFATLASNVRITNEGASTNYVENVVVADNILYGGNGALIMNNSGHAVSNQVRNVLVKGNKWHSKNEVGVPGYYTTGIMSIGRTLGATFEGNTFDGYRGRIYIQDFHDLSFIGNTFRNQIENTNLATKSILQFDGVNANYRSYGLKIKGNWFDEPQGAAIRIEGIKSGALMYEDVFITDNTIRGGPAYENTAITANGVNGILEIARNTFQDFGDITVSSQNCPGLTRFADNVIINQSTALSGNAILFRSATNGTLVGVVDISGNYARNCGGVIDVRNALEFNFSDNRMIDCAQQNPSQAALTYSIAGDGGGNPDSSAVKGSIRNNFVSSSIGYSFKTDLASAPAYTGSKVYLAGNRFTTSLIVPSTHDETITPLINYSEHRSVFGTTTPNAFGAHWRFADTTNATGIQAFFLERANTGNDTHSGKNSGLNLINRVGGSGTNTTQIYAMEAFASWDRASGYANFLKSVAATARWTSSSSVDQIAALYGNVTGSGSGSANFAYGAELSSPVLSGGATITEAGGLRIKSQTVSGVTRGFGINQEGASDANKFAGPFLLLETTTPSVGTNQAALYVTDNGAGKTQIVVKWSDNTTNVLATQP